MLSKSFTSRWHSSLPWGQPFPPRTPLQGSTLASEHSGSTQGRCRRAEANGGGWTWLSRRSIQFVTWNPRWPNDLSASSFVDQSLNESDSGIENTVRRMGHPNSAERV
jgi:hypothetical protein